MLFTENWELFLYNFDFFYFLSEISNYLYLIIVLCLCTYFKLVEKKYFLFWTFFFSTPFFINYVLFDPKYLIDQFLYAREMNEFRSSGLGLIDLSNYGGIKRSRIQMSTVLLSLFPIISYLTVTSLAFVNKLIAFAMFIFLSKRIESSKIILFFIIPSLILYSSVSLRDMLVVGLSVVSLIYLIEKKALLSLFFIILMSLTKIQNAPGYLVMWTFLFLFFVQKSYLRLFVVASLSVVAIILFFDQYEFLVNTYRIAYALEDGMPLKEATNLRIESGLGLVITVFKDLPAFLLRPLPWQISSSFHLMVFVESIVLMFLFYKIVLKDFLFLTTKECTVLFIGFLICMGIYTVTGFNLGTLSRYRFIAFFPFLIGFYYIRTLNDSSKAIPQT